MTSTGVERSTYARYTVIQTVTRHTTDLPLPCYHVRLFVELAELAFLGRGSGGIAW